MTKLITEQEVCEIFDRWGLEKGHDAEGVYFKYDVKILEPLMKKHLPPADFLEWKEEVGKWGCKTRPLS